MSVNLQGAAQAAAADVTRRVQAIGKDTPRIAQVSAACTVPFVFMGLAIFSEVIKDVIFDALPEGFAESDITLFFLGAGLVTGTIACSILWVRTGGFGLFVS